MNARYVEPKEEPTEQDMWEDSQRKKASMVKGGGKKKKDDYEFVFEEEVDFVLKDTKKGYDDSKVVPRVKKEAYVSAEEKMKELRRTLPIYSYRTELLSAVKQNQVLILVGETGSGKTTQVPQYLHEVGYSSVGKIGCTQPRRVAAMSVAARVAKEMEVKLGQEVGYSIRFENCTSAQKTVIQYMTDGMLLREFLTAPDLKDYSCLIIDEAHERTLHTDILFGLVKDIARHRKDLKLIISSATLNAEKFSKYFDDAGIFVIPGRMYPVEMYYTKAPESDYVDACVITTLQIHISQPPNGDILVFLTGQEEIDGAAEALQQRTRALGSKVAELIICPIYANLPSDQQAKIFAVTPKGSRKVVLATNIAETSLTIEGIKYVIDAGFHKQKSFDAKSAIEALLVTPISRAAADQRAGRAGRTQPGKCFRLYTSHSFQHELEATTLPEILRTNMGNVVLTLKSIGIDDLLRFDFLDPPPPQTLMRALEQLYALGALNSIGQLTKMGRRMAEFPLDPTTSKTILASETHNCTHQILHTVSMLSLGPGTVFFRPKDKILHADAAKMAFARGGGGDILALYRCYHQWSECNYSVQFCHENFLHPRSLRRARDVRDQLHSLCERVEIDPLLSSDDHQPLLKAFLSGFFYNVARLAKDGNYTTVKKPRSVHLHPSSVLYRKEKDEDATVDLNQTHGDWAMPKWLVYFELARTSKDFMRMVAPIEGNWISELAPHYYNDLDTQDKKMPIFNPKHNRAS